MTVEEYLILVTLLRKYARIEQAEGNVDYSDIVTAMIDRVRETGGLIG